MARAIDANSLARGASNEVRMILLGRTGAGKSSVGNTILGEKKFKAKLNPKSVTTQCACINREFDGKQLVVVDTPGFLDTNVTKEDIKLEVAKSYQMTAPGPHAFLLVFEPGRFTPQEAEAVEYLTKIFGADAVKHTIIIFTHSDALAQDDTTIEEYLGDLEKEHPLRELLKQCGQRYLAVNNVGTVAEKNETIGALLNMIAKMIADNGGQVYTSDTFKDVAKAIAVAKSEGTYNPYNPDGSYALLPKTKEIVIDGYLRRTIGRRAI